VRCGLMGADAQQMAGFLSRVLRHLPEPRESRSRGALISLAPSATRRLAAALSTGQWAARR